jgi:hypothetical protein
MASTEENKHRAQEMHQYIVDRLAGHYESTDRTALFAAFISTMLTHHEAILTLLNHDRLIGSALALLRPLVEAGFRGMFTGFSASDEQVQEIAKGGQPYPHFNNLVENLDTLFNTDGVFTQYGKETWKTLCGYTHTGLEQLARRIQPDGNISPHYEDDEISELLNSSTAVIVLVAIAFLKALNKSDAADAIQDRYVGLYPVP